MTIAATLQEAAGLSYSNIFPLYIANTVRADAMDFFDDLNVAGLFQNQIVNDRPMINWISVLGAATTEMPVATQPTYDQLNELIAVVYRICWMANDSVLYSVSQRTAVLAAYNAAFA